METRGKTKEDSKKDKGGQQEEERSGTPQREEKIPMKKDDLRTVGVGVGTGTLELR